MSGAFQSTSFSGINFCISFRFVMPRATHRARCASFLGVPVPCDIRARKYASSAIMVASLGCPNLGRPAISGKLTSFCHFRAIHNSVQFLVAAFVTHCPSDSADAQVGIGDCAGLELNLNSRFGQLNVGTAGQLGRQHSEWRLRQSPTVRRGWRLTLRNVSVGAGSRMVKPPARNVAIRPIPVRNPLPSVLKSPL